MYALDAQTGAEKWKFEGPNAYELGSSSPALSADGTRLYVGSGTGTQYLPRSFRTRAPPFREASEPEHRLARFAVRAATCVACVALSSSCARVRHA